MILAINTSTLQFGLAILEAEGNVLAEYLMSKGGGHFGGLMPALHFLVTTSKVDVNDLKGLAVATGPGSFTGLLFPATEGPSPGQAEAARLSPWLIAGVALGSLGFFGVALSAVARAQRMTAKVSTARIVGRRGRVTTSLAPLGTVQIESELWTAVAGHDAQIKAGDEVEVVAVDGLKLLVKHTNEAEPKEGFKWQVLC